MFSIPDRSFMAAYHQTTLRLWIMVTAWNKSNPCTKAWFSQKNILLSQRLKAVMKLVILISHFEINIILTPLITALCSGLHFTKPTYVINKIHIYYVIKVLVSHIFMKWTSLIIFELCSFCCLSFEEIL